MPTHASDRYHGDIVVDLHEITWPVIRHIDWWFAPTTRATSRGDIVIMVQSLERRPPHRFLAIATRT